MDRPIEPKKWTPRRLIVVLGAGLACLGCVAVLIANSGSSQLSVAAERVGITAVSRRAFQEYVPINGNVQPRASVFLDLEEGGIVAKIYLESGNAVAQGDLILSFSNSAAQKQNIEAETRLIDNLNQLRNSKLTLTQSNLILKDQLLDLEYKISELERTFQRFEQLTKAPNAQLSREQFEAVRDQIAYLKEKRTLLIERIRRESELQEQQNTQIDASMRRVNRNLEILARIIDSLEVRAPISGYLSSLNAEIGQSFQRGQRIGQIDRLDTFKVRAGIDQFYVSKVVPGQRGKFEFAGRTYEVAVTKVYPEVVNDVFQADLMFVGGPPDGIKRGQTLQIDLSLGEARTSLVVAKGGFYRHTNGRWIYRVAEDGRSARRVDIVVGRQNPQFVEVLEGLAAGDRVIISSYDSYNDVDELTFSDPIELKGAQRSLEDADTNDDNFNSEPDQDLPHRGSRNHGPQRHRLAGSAR